MTVRFKAYCSRCGKLIEREESPTLDGMQIISPVCGQRAELRKMEATAKADPDWAAKRFYILNWNRKRRR